MYKYVCFASNGKSAFLYINGYSCQHADDIQDLLIVCLILSLQKDIRRTQYVWTLYSFLNSTNNWKCKIPKIFRHFKIFLGGSDGKESTCNAGDMGSIPGLGRSLGEGNGNPLQYSCLENPTDKGSWGWLGVGYSPWGHREVDMTEWLSIENLKQGCVTRTDPRVE